MIPLTKDITLYQRATYYKLYTWWEDRAKTKRKNLTGYTSVMVIKIGAVKHVLSQFNGQIKIIELLGNIILDMPPEDIAQFKEYEGVYSWYITDNEGHTYRIMQGNVIINSDKTES